MSKCHATATAFADFVFRKSTGIGKGVSDGIRQENQRWIGRITEENMRQYRAVAAQSRLAKPSTKWEVIHEDRGGDEPTKKFECRGLTVGGEALKCCPDLVLKSVGDREHHLIIIVERKVRTGFEYAPVPDLSWPNVRAQLWCYAWIEDWDWYKPRNVILMTEYYWRPYPEEGDGVYLGCRGVWNRADPKFNSEAAGHFADYGGKVWDKLEMPSW